MKSTSITPFIALLMIMTTIVGCSADSKKNKDGNKTVKKPSGSAVRVSFKNDMIKPVYDHYIHLKDMLVNSDAKAAQLAATELKKALTKAGNSKGAELAGKIAGTAGIKTQRAEFIGLTAEIENIIRPGTLSAGKIYKQYCPMANEGNGAYWLAGEAEIKNPYFGADMLECGEVKEEIK